VISEDDAVNLPGRDEGAHRLVHARPRALVPGLLSFLILFAHPAKAAPIDRPPPRLSSSSSGPVAETQDQQTLAFDEAMRAGTEAMQAGQFDAAIAAFGRAVAMQPRQSIAHAMLGSALLAAQRAEEALEPLGRAAEIDPESFIAQQNLGLALLSVGRPGEAVQALEIALELEPDNLSVQRMLGRALTLAGRAEEASPILRVVAEGDPDDFLAQRYLGSALLATGHYSEAVDAFTAAARMRPEDLDLQVELARAHLALGERRAEAIALLKTIVDRQPVNYDAWVLLGVSLAAQTDSADAQVDGAKALQRALELKPGDTRASLGLASIYYRFRLHEDAIVVLDEAVAGTSDPSEVVTLELERFRHLHRLNEYERARQAAARAIEAGGGAQAYYYLGFALNYLRDFDGAIEAFRTAIEIDPDMAVAQRELGSLLIDRQLYADARVALERAVAVDPDDAEAHYLLGLALFRAGEAESAIPSLERAVQLDPEHASAYYNLGTVLRMNGRVEEGMAAMRRFQELQAQQTPGENRMEGYLVNLVQRGVFLAKMGRGERAVELFEMALENDPDSDLVLFNLGLILFDLERPEEAADALTRAIESNPERAEAYGALANVYLALGRNEDAMRMRARYEELRRRRQSPTTQPGYVDRSRPRIPVHPLVVRTLEGSRLPRSGPS
jgi:superkiller protein 3